MRVIKYNPLRGGYGYTSRKYGSIRDEHGRLLVIELTPTRVKGTRYLLVPKDIAQLLGIEDDSILKLTIEESEEGQRLVYSIENRAENSG